MTPPRGRGAVSAPSYTRLQGCWFLDCVQFFYFLRIPPICQALSTPLSNLFLSLKGLPLPCDHRRSSWPPQRQAPSFLSPSPLLQAQGRTPIRQLDSMSIVPWGKLVLLATWKVALRPRFQNMELFRKYRQAEKRDLPTTVRHCLYNDTFTLFVNFFIIDYYTK